MPLDLGLIDGNNWDAAAVDAIELAINKNYQTCTSSTRPSSPTEGDKIWETDTDRLYIYRNGSWGLYFGRVSWQVSKASQSIPDTTTTNISFDTEIEDNMGTFTAPSTTISVPLAGYYVITAQLFGPTAWFTNANYRAFVVAGATSYLAGPSLGNVDNAVNFTIVTPMAANDLISVAIVQTTGSAKTFGCNLRAVRVST